MSNKEQCAGRYLGFTLDDEKFGVPIHMVCEIIGAVAITKVPNLTSFMRGVINLRGKIIPMIDLREKFGMKSAGFTKETCFIIVEVEEKQIGVIVDKVNEVMDFEEEQIEPASELRDWQDSKYLVGMGKLEERVVILVNLSGALSKDQIKEVFSRKLEQSYEVLAANQA